MDPAPLTSNITDVALLFEGGGMRVSYTAAVVVALLKARLHFDWVAGISAGSSNTVNYLSRDPWRARESFVEFAADPKFGGVGTFLRGKGMFNSNYIYRETGLPGGVLPFDFATFQANPARMNLGVFEADTGRSFYWTREDTPTLADLMIRVQSSSTLPFFMPMVKIGEHLHRAGRWGRPGASALDAARAAGHRTWWCSPGRARNHQARDPAQPGDEVVLPALPAVVDAVAEQATSLQPDALSCWTWRPAGTRKIFFPQVHRAELGEERRAA